jgi:hypothetical protein
MTEKNQNKAQLWYCSQDMNLGFHDYEAGILLAQL